MLEDLLLPPDNNVKGKSNTPPLRQTEHQLANLLKLICFALLFLFEGHPFFQKVLPFKLFLQAFDQS